VAQPQSRECLLEAGVHLAPKDDPARQTCHVGSVARACGRVTPPLVVHPGEVPGRVPAGSPDQSIPNSLAHSRALAREWAPSLR
jgi:hypothetical protein